MSIVNEYLSNLEFGDAQKSGKMTVIPIMNRTAEGSVYLTLKEALDTNLLEITEVDEAGAVPELKALNRSELPVLILDGEELVGAKQNRVLNTTVLLKGRSETLISVSCTEEGRWSYRSRAFSDEGSVISHSIRGCKRRSVSDFIRVEEDYRSDQTTIWDEVRDTISRENCQSPTGAYQDVYHSKIHEINEYLNAFTLSEGQVGVMVLINDDIKGIDTISNQVAYKNLHEKILKSYAMETVLDKGKGSSINRDLDEKVEWFMNQIKESTETKYKSVGHGWDHRFESDSVLGSALVCQHEVIHASFFKNGVARGYHDDMAGFRMRRGFRG